MFLNYGSDARHFYFADETKAQEEVRVSSRCRDCRERVSPAIEVAVISFAMGAAADRYEQTDHCGAQWQ
jgi:hypothetical protein